MYSIYAYLCAASLQKHLSTLVSICPGTMLSYSDVGIGRCQDGHLRGGLAARKGQGRAQRLRRVHGMHIKALKAILGKHRDH